MKERLMQYIEGKIGLQMKRNHDFTILSERITAETNGKLSPTTLKRLWGYVNDQNSEPSIYTLDLLAEYLGFKDYDDFKRKIGSEDSEGPKILSSLTTIEAIDADDFSIGEEFDVSWAPDRSCTLRHLGNRHFLVVHSVNAQLKAGDTFTTDLFIEGDQLRAGNLSHGGRTGLCYIAGKIGGVHINRKNKKR